MLATVVVVSNNLGLYKKVPAQLAGTFLIDFF